jgi:hypothetical protein
MTPARRHRAGGEIEHAEQARRWKVNRYTTCHGQQEAAQNRIVQHVHTVGNCSEPRDKRMF